jgi:hypothetical protein
LSSRKLDPRNDTLALDFSGALHEITQLWNAHMIAAIEKGNKMA